MKLQKTKVSNLVLKRKIAFVSSRVFTYLFLIVIGFIFLYPLLLTFSNSGKTLLDLYDPRVVWFPSEFQFSNYVRAFNTIGGLPIFSRTAYMMGAVALAQTLSSAVIAYGFSKASFPGHKILFAIMILTFLIPQEIMFIPRYVLYNNYEWIGSVKTLLYPSLLGQGMKQSLFILIFYQFYKMSPPSLDEAAAIDGAGNVRIFLKINLRMAVPAIVTTFVLSLVWNWNDVDTNTMFLGNKLKTVIIAIQDIQGNPMAGSTGASTGEMMDAIFHAGLQSAAIMLCIIPLILIYIIFERQLVESVDMTGITGE